MIFYNRETKNKNKKTMQTDFKEKVKMGTRYEL